MDEISAEFKMWTFLDEAIAETRDVQKLNCLLDMKLGSSCNSYKSKKVHFDSGFVSEIIKNLDCELLKKISRVCDTDDHSMIFKAVMDFINTTKNDIKYQLKIIKLLHFLLKSFETKIFENLSPEFIYDFLIAGLNDPESKSKAFETLTIYFQIFPISQKILCLNKVFEFSMENNNLDIFCALLNATDTKVINDENCCFNIKNSNFWTYIESCISNQKSHLQKQGGYVLTKYTDSKAQLDQSWKAFFILIDIGREKQLHLIEPSLNLFKYVRGLPFLWQKCVYKIYLEHTQTTIVYQVAIEMLKQSYLEENLGEIFRLLFPAINKHEYSNLSNEMFEGLRDFCVKLNKNQLEIVAKELIAVSWNSVSFWKVIQSVFDNKASEKINLYKEVIICAANITNVFIRHKSIQFLIKTFWEKTNYQKIIKIGYCCFKLTKHNNFDYLQDYKVSNQIKYRFKYDPINHFNIWKQCRNYLSDNELAIVLIQFYTTYLNADNCDLFINLFVNASIESEISNAIIHEPLLSPQHYNQYQLYASLALVSSGVNIKIHNNNEAISITYNDTDVIEVKDFSICNACIDIIFKWYPNYEDAAFIELVTHILESQGNKVLCNLYGKLKSLLETTTSKNLVVHFIDLFHKNLLQIKRDQYFKTIVIKFIEAILSSSHITLGFPNSFLQTNSSLVEFSKSSSLIRLSWIQNINKWYSSNNEVCLNETFLEYILWPIYMQGMMIAKDERTKFNLCQEFICNGDDKEEEEYGEFSNPNLLNAKSRQSAISILVDFAGKACELVINYVLEKFNKYYKKRYFPDSAIHYEKLRIIQILLWILIVAHDKVPKKQLEILRTFIFNCFQEETNQNCIKQLLNWLLILVSEDVGTVLDWIDKNASNLSSSVLINIMPAIYHLALTDDNEESLEKTIKMLLPWTMGAQLKLRVYAQDIISRIFKYAQQKNYKQFLDKYNFLQICIATCIESTGDIFENTLKSDFVFLEDFNPVTDKTFSTVFYDIPRLNRVNPTEWMNLNECPSVTFSNAVDTFLSKNQPSIDPNSKLTLDQTDPTIHIQKKITPWKSALVNSQTSQTKIDFILVASLIEKSQNLGGLSRTCEVFGMQTLVFDNAKIVGDKEFKSLSMSSEGWINAVEVKVKDLRDYILSLQKDGYFVVGAEQTAGSKKLNEFQFPRRMALVLGNEKTGIPPDLIPLLDVCLEIPQFGLTRSLNVHVAGATFIWEYAKQHLV